MRVRTTVAVAVVTLAAGVAFAQFPAGGEVLVNTYAREMQELERQAREQWDDTPDNLPKMSALASDVVGNLVVVWNNQFQDGSSGGIIERRFGGIVGGGVRSGWVSPWRCPSRPRSSSSR